MRYVLLSLLFLILAVLLLAVTAVWHSWRIYLHICTRGVLVELRGFGMKWRLLDRDFSKEKKGQDAPAEEKKTQAKPKAEDAEHSEEEPENIAAKKKKVGLFRRFSQDKKRIYDPERGEFQMEGFGEVVQEYKALYRQFQKLLHEVFGDLRYKISVLSTRIRLDFGTGNPAHTGMLYGGIWSAIGTAYPILGRYVHMDYPELEVTPDYYGKHLDFDVRSIIKVRPAHIINVAVKQACKLAFTYCYKHFTKEV